MRATFDLKEDLLRRARQRAAEDGVPLRAIVEAALEKYLSVRKRGRYKLQWRTEHGRPLPDVRLDDRKALFDLMNGQPRDT